MPSPSAVHGNPAQLLAMLAGKLSSPRAFPGLLQTQLTEPAGVGAGDAKSSPKDRTKEHKPQTAKQPAALVQGAVIDAAVVIPPLVVSPQNSSTVATAELARSEGLAVSSAATKDSTITKQDRPVLAAEESRADEAAAEPGIGDVQALRDFGSEKTGSFLAQAVEKQPEQSVSKSEGGERKSTALELISSGDALYGGPADPVGAGSQQITLEIPIAGQGAAAVSQIAKTVTVRQDTAAVTASGIPARSEGSKKDSSSDLPGNAPLDRVGDDRLRSPKNGYSGTAPSSVRAMDNPTQLHDDRDDARTESKIKLPAKAAAAVQTVISTVSLAASRVAHPAPQAAPAQEHAPTSFTTGAEHGHQDFGGTETSAVQSPTAFHSLRLTEHIAGPELHFTWRSPDSGDIQLSTSLHHRDVQMSVNTERTETATAMHAELPSLNDRLHEHSLRLGEVNIVAQERSISTGLGMAGQHGGQREWNAPVRPAATDRELINSETRMETLAAPIGDGRVSVLA